VLKLATLGAMQSLDIRDAGQVIEGARAELLVSWRDPLDGKWDIRGDLIATIAKGTLVYASDLDLAIAREFSRFETLFSGHASRWLAQFTLNRLAKRYVP
jgi:hypothetical protein